MQSDNIAVVKGIAALRAEPGCLSGIFRLPAALITAVLRDTRRLLAATFGAELTGVLSAAAAAPATIVCRFGTATFRAELAL